MEIKALNQIEVPELSYLKTGIEEVDKLFSGGKGIAKNSITMLTGSAGIGKSTLLSMICEMLSKKGIKTLFFSGEESLEQVKQRAQRIGITGENTYMTNSTDIENIKDAVRQIKPELVIIDSIQMIKSEVKGNLESNHALQSLVDKLIEFFKAERVPCIVTGHQTKKNKTSGSQHLVHMTDALFEIHKDPIDSSRRFIIVKKNRFGPENSICYRLKSDGIEFLDGVEPKVIVSKEIAKMLSKVAEKYS